MENKEIKEELISIKNNMDWIEKDKGKNNVILNGLLMDNIPPLKEGGKEHRQGKAKSDHKGQRSNRNRSTKDKMEVMKNKSISKDLKLEKLFIDNDLTRNERPQQRIITFRTQGERRKGNNINMGYNKR